MTMNVNANNIIDILIAELQEIQNAMIKMPHGVYIDESSPYRKVYDSLHIAERRITIISDALEIQEYKLYGIARTARKWYEKGNWQFCLSESVAERLLASATR